MGKLYELVKQEVEYINKYYDLQKKNFMESRKYEKVLKIRHNIDVLSKLCKSIDKEGPNVFGSKQNYYNYLSQNIAPQTFSFPEIIYDSDYHNEIEDYEKIINDIEKNMTEEQIQRISNRFLENKANMYEEPSHPFDEEVKKMIADVNAFTENDMSQEEKAEIIKSLEYANEMLIQKNSEYHDKAIDETSAGRNKEALKHTDEFARENNIDLTKLDPHDLEYGITALSPKDKTIGDMYRPLLDKKLVIRPDFKMKIRALDSLVKYQKLLNLNINGESGSKEYGFLDWFVKANELKDAMYNYTTLDKNNTAQRVLKLREINTLSNELKVITTKYNEVLTYIKNNFDLDKTGLPNNVYSGRAKIANNLEDFVPNLPPCFDNENAPYGSILNAYSQTLAFCKNANITLDEFLEDPLNSALSYFRGKTRAIDNKFILNRGPENPLGKRIARALVQNHYAYNDTMVYNNQLRCLEILTKLTDYDENTMSNMLLANLGGNYVHTLQCNGPILFGEDNGLDNIKNLFCMGDERDNLLSLSDKHVDDNFNYEDIKSVYNQTILAKANVNPLDECNRMMNIMQDYFVERNRLYNDPTLLKDIADYVTDSINPASFFLAAKEYFNEYIIKNNINIFEIRDEAQRNKVLEFTQDPAAAFYKYRDKTKNIFVADTGENITKIRNEFGQRFYDKHKTECEQFVQTFGVKNNQGNGFNRGKDIETILTDNKGGFWERYILHSTSPQYRALVDVIEETLNSQGFTYGDLELVKYHAKKYLDYKLNGRTVNDLSTTGKKRVEFCKTILESLNSLDDKYKDKTFTANEPAQDLNEPRVFVHNEHDLNVVDNNVKINQPAQDLDEPGKKIDNDLFHDKIKNNIEENNIDNVDKEEIENNEIDLNREKI